ncbi:MAG: hypothetical protein IJT46_01825 [Bacteroidaceae bacterium]|nr:hypothetical protein [Bacteroidaceae bacterium]
MESLLYQLINHIKENMPSLSLVDEDYGQLEAIDKEDMQTYPVTFPCVLIDMPETEWSNLSGKSQKGKTKVNVRLVIDCYDDTHYGSGTMEAMHGRTEMVRDLHRFLQCYRPDGDGELIREKSRFYTWSHGIKVYEMLYSVSVSDIIQETVKAAEKPRVVLSVQKL